MLKKKSCSVSLTSTLAAALLMASSSGFAHGGGDFDARPDPKVNGGERAREWIKIQQNRAHLSDLARAHGLQPDQLEKMAAEESALWIDRESRLYYVCDGVPAAGDPTEEASSVTAAVQDPTATMNSSDAFKLHSLPGATRVIYLDFTGHVTTNTSWNNFVTSGAAINSAPFDMDGNPASFSAAEMDRIKKIWQRVAEDFMPFAVDVTTEDPGLDRLRRTSTSDNAYGIRVVISPTNGWYGNAGGVAYLGSFNWTNSDTPAFVFSGALGPNNEKYIAEAISHETGHTLGLSHDGKSGGTSYYGGQGNWAPIMGVSYYKPVTQWSKGEYAGANNLEDDIAKMATYGAPFLSDDYGNDLAHAAVVTGSPVTIAGVIATRSDVDVFKINAGAGTINLTVSGVGPEMNLDVKAELLSSNGSVIATSNPTNTTASLNATVATGTYYLRIDGVGYLDPASTGYSDYASVGEYVVTGSVPTGISSAAPTAVASANPTSGVAPLTVGFSSAGSADSDGVIASYSWNFGDGSTSSSANPSKVYSTAGTYTAVLTVTDNTGLTSTASRQITVSPQTVATGHSWNTMDGGFEAATVTGTGYYAFAYNPSLANFTFDSRSGVSRNNSGFTAGLPSTPDGAQVAFVQMRGTISTSPTFGAGTYRIRALVANRANVGSKQTVSVMVDNQVVGNFTGVTSWTTASTNTFTVSAGTHTIKLVGQSSSDSTLFIDRLVVESATAAIPMAVGSFSFESPHVGSSYAYNPAIVAGAQDWQFKGTCGVSGNGSNFTKNNPGAPEGSQVAFLQKRDSTISQTLNFGTAGNYTLTLKAAMRGIWNTGTQTVEVLIDGVLVGSFSPNSTQYQTYTIPFTATQGSHTLAFRGTASTDATAFLDDVEITL